MNKSNEYDSVLSSLDNEMRKYRRLQRTLASPTSVKGVGYWTGKEICVEFRPAPPGTGYVFVRTDLTGAPRVPALVQHRETKPRQTSLSIGEARVDMIEHVLAALKGLSIDNCEIRVNAAEMPAAGGCCAEYVSAMTKAKSVPQAAFRPIRCVVRPFSVSHESGKIDVVPTFDGQTHFYYKLNYGNGHPIPKQEAFYTQNPENFRRELMNCRTFLSKEEADQLQALGLGGRATYKDLLVFDEHGPIENKMLHPNECARHKILDMLGDFALVPFDLVGEFSATKSGHHLNAECIKAIMQNSLQFGSQRVGTSDECQERIEKLLETDESWA